MEVIKALDTDISLHLLDNVRAWRSGIFSQNHRSTVSKECKQLSLLGEFLNSDNQYLSINRGRVIRSTEVQGLFSGVKQ